MSAAAYHRGKGRAVYIRVPAPGGGSRLRSTKTSDKRVARDMRDALAAMKRRKMWRELQAVLDGAPGFTLDDVRDAWAAERLSSLTAKLADADLEPYVARWHDALAVKHAARAHAERPTADHYRLHLRTLVAEGHPFPRSRFTPEALTAWLGALPWKPATKARYHAAARSFGAYLVRAGVLERNPLDDVARPGAAEPRTRHLTMDETRRLLDRCPERARLVETLAHASGMELAALRHLRRRDVDAAAGRVHAHGTKNRYRDRVVYVEPWGRPALAAAVAGRLPDALVFPELATEAGRHAFRYLHRQACAAAGIADYRFHDARHTFAVRNVAAGVPMEYVARQLGHADASMVARVYGRFRPTEADVARYHRMAEARDAEQREAK